MKTFTTYAEKKAKQFFNLLQGYTKGIRITAILILLLMGVSNAWAASTVQGGYIYFDATQSGWSVSDVQMVVGHNSYSNFYGMSNISNTSLYYLKVSGWSDATYFAFANGCSNWGGENNKYDNRKSWITGKYTAAKTNYTLNNNNSYLFYASTSSNNASITTSSPAGHLSGGYNDLNSEQTINTVVDGTVANSKATISLTSYKMTGNGAVTKQEATHGTGSKDSYISAARTATTTFTVGDVEAGYQFDGWYTEATGGTQLSTEKTYTYYPTAATTVYARFSTKQHTVLFGVHSSGHGAITAKVESTSISSGNKVNYGSTIVFTATPSAGYQIEGWYKDSNCTTSLGNGTNNTYTVTVTTGTNVYVKFEEMPATSHNITYTPQKTGWTYGNSNPTTAEEGATVTFVVNPTAGYRVSVSSDGPALTGPNANNQYTFTMPTKDVKITVDAKPEQYTVTLNRQSGTGGTSSVTATYAAAMPTITPPTRTGYTFNGYFDATSGGTKYYDANGSSEKNWDKTSNTTLYAQWTANQYTVKFNANNGTGTMSNQSFTYNEEKALTANAFTRKGYTFLGWAKSSSATTATYTDKQTVKNLTDNNNAIVNLYAVWQALPPTPVILKPNDQWKQANARYAIYYWGDGTDNIGWVEMTDLGCSGEYFTAEVPASYLDFKFVRLDPKGKGDASKNDGLHWDYKWNETGNLTTPAADKNLLDLSKLYLTPNSNWKQSNARFAAYFFKKGDDAFGNTWVSMSDSDADGIYECDIPKDKEYPNVIFCRMNPSTNTNNWDNRWNQTGDLEFSAYDIKHNYFTVPSGAWDNSTTGWSILWTTYTVPTYTININAPEAGSIAVTVGDNTTTVTNTPQQITNIAAGSTFTVAYTPSPGFKLGHSEINGTKEEYTGAGEYTVCGPVDITAHFVTEEDQVVYLRPNDTWLSDKAIFYAYAFNRYGGNEWIELTTKETDYTGAYGCTIPPGYSDVIFVRINPTAAEPSWNDNVKWNQSVDYVIPVNPTNNRFIIGEKITAEGADKDKYQGSWEASDTPIYGIPGDWQNDWKADEYPLIGPDGLVTVNITQTNDTLGFKVYQYPYGSDDESDQWLGNNGTMVRGGEGVHEGGWTMETGANNCGLGVDVAGDYVFAFNIRDKKLTVTYPEIPEPTTSILNQQRVFEDALLDWFAGNGTEADPYQLYADEAARITVSPLPEVEGLTAYYTFGNTAEQTSNIFDWKGIYSTATNLTVTAYYKNAMGTKIAEATVKTSYFKTLALPFNLMTQPKDEINIDRIKAGANITVQFRSDSRADVDLYLGDTSGSPITNFSNTISTDYEYDVPDDIQPCIITFIAKAKNPVHGRTFEKSVDVVIYKNVIIKVNDPEGWVKNVYMWRDYSDAVLTPWPGDPVLQNYGTWRVFSVKYPYYDRFIINDGNSGGSTQTLDWELPADDTCYELLDPENNGSDKAEDKGKYGLKVADCPGNLIVEDIENVTLMEGEQIVVMPKIYVGLGYQVADIKASVYYDDNGSINAMMSGTNVTILGNAEGDSEVTVTYILDNVRIEKKFTVSVTKRTKITIQVKVPTEHGPEADRIGWWENDKIYVRYWNAQNGGTDQKMNYLTQTDYHYYFEATIPLDDTGKTNFNIFYDNRNEDWRYSTNATDVTEDGCYLVYNDGSGDRGLKYEDVRCLTQYQVRIAMGNGKTFTSNIVTAEEDTLSFFAPGMNETGYKAGVIMLYQNDKMIATIEPSTFAKSDVYTATVNETGDGLDNVSTYSGNFYIRTWGSSYATKDFIDGHGWNSIKDLTANEKDSLKFTYFISRENEFYNHYWVQAMHTIGFTGKDVSACVANEYNDDLAGKLTQGKGTNENGNIEVKTEDNKQNDFVINVRFGYDPRTNYFGRAIIKGSEYNNYLNIHCDNAYKDKNCSTKLPYGTSGLENKMQDISNWVYQRDFYVPITNSYPSASLYVEATSPSIEITAYDHLLGYVINEVTGEESNTPVQRTVIGSGTTNGTYLIRVVYDFKTNRIIAAWVPQGTIEVTDDRTLNADVLFVRKENEEVPQIKLANEGKIRSLESMYFALELERGDKDAANRHEEQYFFTLPFNSIVGSISGVPGYMQTWGIQRYRGDLRAQKGWFIETPTFWEWMSLTDTLYAGEGYALVFDKKNAPWNEIGINDGADTISMMRLYFPSDTSGFDMQQQSAEHLIRKYPNHPCTITREDRDKQDSNWKVIGTTSYNNAGINAYSKDTGYEEWKPEKDTVHVDVPDDYSGWSAPMFRYSYRYEWDNGEFKYFYTPEDGKEATYKSFFGYMVQFAGTINWQPIMSETVPEGIAARRRVAEGERTSYTTRLELANTNGEKQDQAFVALDEKATTTFDQNKDLNKIINTGTNLYTLSEDIPFAGNTLPMEKVTVPVGVRIATAGEYTFRMPDGTDGISVILLDNQTGTQTNMLYDEYTVTLDAGTIENRFYLILDPKRTATSLEDVLGDGNEANGDEAKGVEKFIIDGQLIIRTADGIYDAQGQRM
ncbi:MAG: InlB B-repeat-containing protein [Paludibacteraceae bacterium]|nr:InlB B-repeat-containing protein [Paludibacteraceae bacterium]